MTVSNRVPLVEYTGNGSITSFAFDWDMIGDSLIGVLVDNFTTSEWQLQGNSVVFDTAPADGALIQIFRRTLIYMPEDYVPFGEFPGNKTELSMDRAYMIAAERAGNRTHFGQPDGIVGGANLFMTRGEYDIVVHSERGTDAVVPLWNPDGIVPTPQPPDPAIVWDGKSVDTVRVSTGSPVNCRFRLKTDLSGGSPGFASAWYDSIDTIKYIDWLDHDPVDGEYWMRVFLISDTHFTGQSEFRNEFNTRIPYGEAIPINRVSPSNENGPWISITNLGKTPPVTRTARFIVEICADDGGRPDGNWATGTVKLETIFRS